MFLGLGEDTRRTEENSYCEDDCCVLNEGKLLGCPTVVYSMKENFLGARLIKICLVGTTYVHSIPLSSFSTQCGCVRTEETETYVHCVNGLDQNAYWYVNRHGVDRLSGAIVIYTGCHARMVVLCYTPGRPSVSNYLCAQLLLQFPSELDLFEICHKGIQSFRHPVISTPSQFDTFSCKCEGRTAHCEV